MTDLDAFDSPHAVLQINGLGGDIEERCDFAGFEKGSGSATH